MLSRSKPSWMSLVFGFNRGHGSPHCFPGGLVPCWPPALVRVSPVSCAFSGHGGEPCVRILESSPHRSPRNMSRCRKPSCHDEKRVTWKYHHGYHGGYHVVFNFHLSNAAHGTTYICPSSGQKHGPHFDKFIYIYKRPGKHVEL